MPYQYVREPLTAEEADRLANACETPTEQLIVWTLLDTGLRVGELCALTAKDILWQQRQLRIRGKGGPYGKRSKLRVVPMSRRVRTLLEHHFALQKEFPVKTSIIVSATSCGRLVTMAPQGLAKYSLCS